MLHVLSGVLRDLGGSPEKALLAAIRDISAPGGKRRPGHPPLDRELPKWIEEEARRRLKIVPPEYLHDAKVIMVKGLLSDPECPEEPMKRVLRRWVAARASRGTRVPVQLGDGTEEEVDRETIRQDVRRWAKWLLPGEC